MLGTGYLSIQTVTAYGAVIVRDVSITVLDEHNATLFEFNTDEFGHAPDVPLEAPDKWLTEDPETNEPRYSMYKVIARAHGYTTLEYDGVMIWDTSTSILKIEMEPLPENPDGHMRYYYIGGHKLDDPEEKQQIELNEEEPERIMPRVLPEVVIPNFIRVHLGRMENPSRIVSVPFIEYIKNVTTHEIFDTWPEQSIIANVHCIVSFTLNRVFTNTHRLGRLHFALL
jgi:hypothetical protein